MSKTVDYALRLLVCLAVSRGESHPAQVLAEAAVVPPSLAAKILHFLASRGLALSRRGPHGGYSLREPNGVIHVCQVISLFNSSGGHSISELDPVEEVRAQVFQKSREEWEQMTIDELAQRTSGRWKLPKPSAA